MVLFHKLKQLEGLDIEQLNNTANGTSVPLGGKEDVMARSEETVADPSKHSKDKAPSPRRPLTRSQTGRVPKRRHRDESPAAVEVQKKPSAPRKRSKAPVKLITEPEDEDAHGEEYVATPPPQPNETPDVMDTSFNTPSLSATQLTFLDSSSSSIGTNLDRRGPRSRSTLPIPVPNLTKKSRGRRVPTKLATDDGIDQKETRLYVCKVESCGKCFHRGEHLKRHIRSIHTHEKPFKCTYSSCDKHFNRHDNLLQHLKVHKGLETSSSSRTEETDSPKHTQQRPPLPLPSPPPPPRSRSPHNYSSASAAYEASINQARMAGFHQQPPFMTYTAAYASILEPTSFATNMAVSSLRTEIPHSPPTSRRYDIANQHFHVGFAN